MPRVLYLIVDHIILVYISAGNIINTLSVACITLNVLVIRGLNKKSNKNIVCIVFYCYKYYATNKGQLLE